MKKSFFLTLLILIFPILLAQAQKKAIIIEINVSDVLKTSSKVLNYEFVKLPRFTRSSSDRLEKRPVIANGKLKWRIVADQPIRLYSTGLLPKSISRDLVYVLDPGDSVHIRNIGGQFVYSGKGAINFQMAELILKKVDSIQTSPEFKNLSYHGTPPPSLSDFFAWMALTNKQENCVLNAFEKNKIHLSQNAYTSIKSCFFEKEEQRRLGKFLFIRRNDKYSAVNQYGLTNKDVGAIYDSVMCNPAAKWLVYERPFFLYFQNVCSIFYNDAYRQRGQFFMENEHDTVAVKPNKESYYTYIYEKAKSTLSGLKKEQIMSYTLGDGGMIHDFGFTPNVEKLLKDYYAQSKFPMYKKLVKEYEILQRAKWASKIAPDFTLSDLNGKELNSSELKNKIVIVDFWFTGCTGCVQMAPALRTVENYFEKDTNVVFLSVSIDKDRDQWLNSVSKKIFTSGGGIQAYTQGEGNKHDMIKTFFVESYPTLAIIDPQGLFYENVRRYLDPRLDNGKALIAFIQKNLSAMKDGPYVLYEEGIPKIYSVSGDKLSSSAFNGPNFILTEVQTDSKATFSVRLKPHLAVEPAEFEKPSKLLVLSDIEGNFDAFRKLLQANHVIDENYNWTFGTGHLAFAGDMFDRGRQVTECLWLTYSLEEKAKAAGGYVHFILGNHEIMTLQGDERYMDKKYKNIVSLTGKPMKTLYGENSELGRWLRTKNIAEKIGDILVVHGGISSGINALPITVPELSSLIRPYYADNSSSTHSDNRIKTITSSSTSPYWYRTYYENKAAIPAVIDSTLTKFGVSHIVTGHTVVSDTVSMWHGGKIFNTDTHHDKGKSEALLIENDKFYRVNDKGQRWLLLDERKKKAIAPTSK